MRYGFDSRQQRPVMALLDLLSRRHAMRVLWELRCGSSNFRTLRDRAGDLSPNVLSRRLGELRGARLVTHRPGAGYDLTDAGRALLELFAPINRFANAWAEFVDAAPATDEEPS